MKNKLESRKSLTDNAAQHVVVLVGIMRTVFGITRSIYGHKFIGCAMALMVMSLLSACSSHQSSYQNRYDPSPSRMEIRAALTHESPEKKISALQELRDRASGDQKRDLQALIVRLSLDIDPTTRADRKMFLDGARELSRQIVSVPVHRVPDDTAVLVHLASLANEEISSPLSATMARRVNNLADPASLRKATKGNLAQRTRALTEKALAEACLAWVNGDGNRAVETLGRALKWDAALRGETIIPEEVTPSRKGAFTIFEYRLEEKTGICFDAAKDRLIGVTY